MIRCAAALVYVLSAAAQGAVRYPSPVELAVSPDGARLFIVCEGTDEIVVADSHSGAIVQRIDVGRHPRGVSFGPGGGFAFVPNAWSDAVSVIDTAALRVVRTMPAGWEPSSVVQGGPQGYLYVANRIGGDVSIIDPESGEQVGRVVGGRGASYLATSPDRSRIYCTHVYPNIGNFRKPPESEITEIDSSCGQVTARHAVHNAAGIFHIALLPGGKLGIASLLRPKNLIPLAHVAHGSTLVNSIAIFGNDVGGVVQVPLDEIEQCYSMPFGIALSPDGSAAYISTSGSDSVTVISIPRLLAAIRSDARGRLANDLSASARYVVARIPVGRHPRGLALSPDGQRLYVANRLDDTISVIDTAMRKTISVFGLGGPEVLTTERRGERLFNSARFSFHGQFSCSSCHIDASLDGLSWDLEPDGFGIDIVDNRSLEDVGETAPYKWNGGNPDLETECGPRTEKFFFRSQGFSPSELADLVRYIKSISLRPNRFRAANGELTESQERGKFFFERINKRDGTPIPEALQCPSCHSGPYHTNRLPADVGTGKSTDRSPVFDTPHLTNIALSAPYLHDGSARSLEEIWTVFNPQDTHGVTNDLAKDELNDLIEYIKTL